MNISGRDIRQVTLLTLVILIVPMIVFPELFGLQLAAPSFLNVMSEFVLYGFVMFLFHRHESLYRILRAAGICLAYRLAVGAVLGLMIATAYSMNLRISMMLGVFSYVPAVALQVVATPIALWPVLRQLFSEAYVQRLRSLPERVPAREVVHAEAASSLPAKSNPPTQAATSQSKPAATPAVNQPKASTSKIRSTADYEPISLRPKKYVPRTSTAGAHEPSGFERAVAYIGEHSSVKLASAVDLEGLVLASFHRGNIEPDEWAPYAVVFCQQNEQMLQRTQMGHPERLDIFLPGQRLTISREATFYLLVLAERQSDELLGIRITQGMEMIRKYISERYSEHTFANAESIHV